MRTPACRFLVATVACASMHLTACGSTTANAPPPGRPAYPGRCVYLGLEQVSGPGDQDSDSVSLIATYRFDDPRTPHREPLSVGFRVERSRVSDLRAKLDQHPTVLCRPDATQATPSRDALDLPPIEGARTYEVHAPTPP
jgi:hypothetical protein